MKTAFVLFSDARSYRKALKIYSWACVCIRVDSGWKLFGSKTDYKTWKNQK